jgi:AcrR family transcriptional regulator
MARPSQGTDTALLASGAALYPQHGCAALSVRKVAEHAGVNPAMLHYHFGSKDSFLRAVLQQVYEGLFERLSHSGPANGTPAQRLRATLLSLAQFVREQRPLLARLLMDAAAGEPVVQSFLRDNAPRHLGLLMQLLAEAGAHRTVGSPLQTFVFVMGAVAMPVLMVSGASHLQVLPAPLAERTTTEVLSDAALVQRINLALGALGLPPEATPKPKPRRKRP